MKKPENLNDLIIKYPKIFELMNEGFYRISSDLPKQWVDIVDQLCSAMQSYTDDVTTFEKGKRSHPQQTICTQIKEKYGGLRFYTTGGTKETEGMIYMAEDMCDKVCQACGSTNDVQPPKNPRAWVVRLCKTCRPKEE